MGSTNLPPQGGASTAAYLSASLVASQTSPITVGSAIEFDTPLETSGDLTIAGTGIVSGFVGGKTYKFTAVMTCGFSSATGSCRMQFFIDGALRGGDNEVFSVGTSGSGSVECLYTPSAASTAELRISHVNGLNQVTGASRSHITITEI